ELFLGEVLGLGLRGPVGPGTRNLDPGLRRRGLLLRALRAGLFGLGGCFLRVARGLGPAVEPVAQRVDPPARRGLGRALPGLDEVAAHPLGDRSGDLAQVRGGAAEELAGLVEQAAEPGLAAQPAGEEHQRQSGGRAELVVLAEVVAHENGRPRLEFLFHSPLRLRVARRVAARDMPQSTPCPRLSGETCGPYRAGKFAASRSPGGRMRRVIPALGGSAAGQDGEDMAAARRAARGSVAGAFCGPGGPRGESLSGVAGAGRDALCGTAAGRAVIPPTADSPATGPRGSPLPHGTACRTARPGGAVTRLA